MERLSDAFRAVQCVESKAMTWFSELESCASTNEDRLDQGRPSPAAGDTTPPPHISEGCVCVSECGSPKATGLGQGSQLKCALEFPEEHVKTQLPGPHPHRSDS